MVKIRSHTRINMAANNLRLLSVPFFFNRVFIIICFLVVSSFFYRSYRFTERGSCCFPDCCDLCMKKSYELLKRRTNMACSMVFMYLGICGITVGVFGEVIVRVGDDYGLFTKILQIKRVVEEVELKYLSDLGIARWRCYGYGFYELYDPSTVMFFFRKKHMIDIGTGNNNKINWALKDKQVFISIIETVYRGARKGCGLVIAPPNTAINLASQHY